MPPALVQAYLGGAPLGLDLYRQGVLIGPLIGDGAPVPSEPAAGPTPPPPSGVGTPLPAATRTLNVTNQTGFNQALNDAVGGDHLVLADGTYTGPGTWTKSGGNGNPIVVRAANPLGARINGSFNPNGSDLIFHYLDFVSATMAIGQFTQSDRVAAWRCRWRDRPLPAYGTGGVMGIRLYKTNQTDIAYCEFANWGGRGISAGFAAGTRNPTIRRCLFRNQPYSRQGTTQHNAMEAVQLGFGTNDWPIDSGALVELCRFDDWNNDDEVLSLKTSRAIVRLCSFNGCEGGPYNRGGRFNRFEANEIRNGRGFVNFDGPNYYLGNKHTGNGGFSFGELSLMEGNAEAGTSGGDSTMNRSSGVVVSGNEIATGMILGRDYSSNPLHLAAKDTRIREHTGAIAFLSQTGTDDQRNAAETNYQWLPRQWLEAIMVGPFA